MATDRLGGTTYTFQNLNAFLANQPSTIQFLGDESAPSVVQQRRHRDRAHQAGVLHRLRAGRVARRPRLDAELRPALRLLHADSRGEQSAGQVQRRYRRHRSRTRRRSIKSTKTNFQPRCRRHLRGDRKTIFRGGFGMFVGPGQTEDQIQTDRRLGSRQRRRCRPVRPRISCSIRRRDVDVHQQSEQPLVPAARLPNEYTIPERIWQYTGIVSRISAAAWSRRRRTSARRDATCSCGASPNPIVNVVTNPNPANAALVIRQFSIVQRDADRRDHRRAESLRRRSTPRPAAATTTTTRCSSACRAGRRTACR